MQSSVDDDVERCCLGEEEKEKREGRKRGEKRGGKRGEEERGKERGKEKAEIWIVYCHPVIDTYSCLPRISFLANARAVITPHSSRTEITMCMCACM